MRRIPLTFTLLWLALACQEEGSVNKLESAMQAQDAAREMILTDIELDARLELVAEIPHPFDLPWHAAQGLCWSPRGETLSIRYSDGGYAYFWQIEPIKELDFVTTGAVAASPQGDWFITVEAFGQKELRASIRRPNDLEVKRVMRSWAAPYEPNRLSIHSAGSLALLHSQSWPSSGSLVSLTGSDPPIPILLPNSLGLAPDCAWVPNQDFFLWQPQREVCDSGLDESQFGIEDLYLSNVQGAVQRGIADHYGPVRDLPLGRELWADSCLIGPIVEYAVSPDGKSLIYSAYRNNRGRLGRLLIPAFEHSHGRDDIEVESMCYLTSDRILITPRGEEARLELWNAEQLKRIKTLPIAGGLEVSVSRDGSRLAVADKDRVRVYRAVESAP